MLTPDRQKKIENVVSRRCFSIPVVLESIYDRGNISAVMRTAEGLGFTNFHVIETQEKFKQSQRVTQGADKWIETKKWKTSAEAIKYFNKAVTSITDSYKESSYKERSAPLIAYKFLGDAYHLNYQFDKELGDEPVDKLPAVVRMEIHDVKREHRQRHCQDRRQIRL